MHKSKTFQQSDTTTDRQQAKPIGQTKTTVYDHEEILMVAHA